MSCIDYTLTHKSQVLTARASAQDAAKNLVQPCLLRADAWKAAVQRCHPVEATNYDADHEHQTFAVGPLQRSSKQHWEHQLSTPSILKLYQVVPKPFAIQSAPVEEFLVFHGMRPGEVVLSLRLPSLLAERMRNEYLIGVCSKANKSNK